MTGLSSVLTCWQNYRFLLAHKCITEQPRTTVRKKSLFKKFISLRLDAFAGRREAWFNPHRDEGRTPRRRACQLRAKDPILWGNSFSLYSLGIRCHCCQKQGGSDGDKLPIWPLLKQSEINAPPLQIQNCQFKIWRQCGAGGRRLGGGCGEKGWDLGPASV